jgi:hypothetical protein
MTYLRRETGRTGPLLVAPALALILTACAGPAGARTIEVGPDKQYKQPSEAIRAASDGDTVRIAAGEYFDCAFVTANNLTIEGTGPDASAVLTDKTCGGKGLLITTGNNITIRNLTLTRARVPDGNGAGIRAEGSGLTVERVRFINNEDGILGGAQGSTMTIRDSDFTRNGSCESGGCAHGVYTGQLALLRIERTKFADTRRGHHIKSMAVRTEIIGCDINDGATGTASYLIDLPRGGSLVVRDSKLTKGAKAENHTAAIMLGEDGVAQATREIVLENNVFHNEGSYKTAFIKNFSATDAQLRNNKISGSVIPLIGEGQVQ